MMDGALTQEISFPSMIDTVLRPAGWALLHFLWQGALVATLVAGLLRLLRPASAGARYAVACTGLALMALLPVATLFGFGPGGMAAPGVAVPAVDGTEISRAAPAVAESTEAARTAAPGSVAKGLADLETRIERVLPALFAVWAFGVVLLAAAHLGGWRRVLWMRREIRTVDERWQAAVARLAERLGIRRKVRLGSSSRVAVPTVVGWLRPAILVPAAALTGLSVQQLEAVLAHELAHVRRHDYLVNLFQVTVETLLFYHPGVWWLSRRIRIEREHCCDDLAVRVCGDPVVYARALTDLESLRSRRLPVPAFALGADGGSLLARVRRLVGRRQPPGHAWLEIAVAGLIAALIAALGSALLLVAAPLVAMPAPQEDEAAESRHEEVDETRQAVAGTSYERLSDAELAELAEEGLDGEDLRELVHAGYTDLSTDALLTLAREGLDGEDLRELHAAGYTDLSIDEIAMLAREGLDGEDVRDLHAAGYQNLSLDELILLAREGLDGEDVRDLHAAGYRHLSLEELAMLAREGVDGEDVRDLHAAGYQNLSVDELILLAREGLDGEDVRELHEAGYRNLSVDELVMLAREGVDGEDVRELHEAGHGELSLEEILRLTREGVDGEDVRELRDAGLELSFEEILLLAREGVDGEDVRELRKSGIELSLEEILMLSREGVDGDDVRELREAGLTDLSVDQVLLLSREGVDGDEVGELRDAGLTDLSIDDLLRLARQGVDGDEVRELRGAGLTDLSIEDILRLARWGVDGGDVEALRGAGHENLTVDKIIDLVRRGEL